MLFFKQPYRTHSKPFHKYGTNFAQSRKQKEQKKPMQLFMLSFHALVI